MQLQQLNPNIQNNSDAYAFFMNEQARIIQDYNTSHMMAHIKGAFAGISSLAASGVAITGAAVALHVAGIAGAALVFGALAVSGVGIVAIAASILWWIILANQSDVIKLEKESEHRVLHANVLRNVNKNVNFYQKHIEVI